MEKYNDEPHCAILLDNDKKVFTCETVSEILKKANSVTKNNYFIKIIDYNDKKVKFLNTKKIIFVKEIQKSFQCPPNSDVWLPRYDWFVLLLMLHMKQDKLWKILKF